MRGSRQRAGEWIRSGPSGAPPPNARAWEVGNVSPVGVLVRYSGALYYDRVAAKGWMCTGSASSSWVDVGALGDLVAADFVVANDFDPVVSGLAAPVGSRARTLDGAKAWLKYGAADADWRSLNETRASVTNDGGTLSAMDLTIAVPQDRGCVVEMDILGTLSATLYLRVNGAQATMAANGMYIYGQGVNSVLTPSIINVDNTGPAFAHVVIGRVFSGRRLVSATIVFPTNGNYSGFTTYGITDGVLTSVGVGGSNVIAHDSAIRAKVEDGWVSP